MNLEINSCPPFKIITLPDAVYTDICIEYTIKRFSHLGVGGYKDAYLYFITFMYEINYVRSLLEESRGNFWW